MEFRKMNLRQVFVTDAAGGGAPGAGGMQKFSASAVSSKIDEIIKYKNEIYDTLKALTTDIDSKVNNDGDAVLGGAVGDLKTDWQAFQTKYNEFSTSMDKVKAAIKKAGDSYDTFNRSLAAAADSGTGNCVIAAGGGSANTTLSMYTK